VAELELSTYGYTLAKWPTGAPIFANESRGYRYYMEEMVVQSVAGRSNVQAVLILSSSSSVVMHLTVYLGKLFALCQKM